MRIELELIEKIERYLNNQMIGIERTTFEAQIDTDPKLKEKVMLQQEIMNGIERTILKQKVTNAEKRFGRGRNFIRWGLTGVFLLIIIAAVLIFNHKKDDQHLAYNGNELPDYNEEGNKNWAMADRHLEAQNFFLDASNDTVIETKGGLVLSIPANGFFDKNGQPVKGKFILVVKEALDAASIIKAGLSTHSGDQLLETGGMFFLDARKNGEILQSNPSNSIYAEVPTDSIKPGMQVFTGSRMPDSNIDWINPRPLEHNLIPVDIEALNFYPPHYLDSINKWGYDAGNKIFTDSLYFSAASIFEAAPPEERIMESEKIVDTTTYSDSSVNIKPNYGVDTFICGINPAKIKAIWNNHFQKTLLSTREFEERIPFIHQSANNEILDLYINNLDKELSQIDSLAVVKLHEKPSLSTQFLSFALRHDGKIKNGNKQFDMLRAYYQRKATAFTEAIAKTQREFWNKQAELDNQALNKQLIHQSDSLVRLNKNFEDEFSLNLKEAWKQLGYDTTNKARSWNRRVYTVKITNMGWCNVDRFVEESVLNRENLNYTDAQSGKKAIIQYLPVSFQINEPGKFDRLSVYLLPDKLTSYMQVAGTNGKYSGKMDELMKYKLVCVGFKDDQSFLYSNINIVSRDYPGIVLTPISTSDLDRELNEISNSGQSADLKKENLYIQFNIRGKPRQNHNHQLLELRQRLYILIFPCTMSGVK